MGEVETKSDIPGKIQWHPGFYAAAEITNVAVKPLALAMGI